MFGQLARPSSDPVGTSVVEVATAGGITLDPAAVARRSDHTCTVLEFARSGAMWITGMHVPTPVCFPLFAHLDGLSAGIETLSGRFGHPVRLDPALVVAQRAAERGFTRGGRRSANGSCRLIRGADGWLACNLPRSSDLELLPAILERPEGDNPWSAVQEVAGEGPVAELEARAQRVGVAITVLDVDARGPGRPPVTFERVGRRSVPVGPPRVLDFSALWAGPLCAHILGRSGAQVCKVEDPARPDGGRRGDPLMYRRLHQGHDLEQVSFSTSEGRRELGRLVDGADVVIESSRPRALEQLGLSPQRFLSEAPGRTWISITGYGRRGPRANHVAFGDDAAVAGGLVAWEAPDLPVFCADALADPVSGLFAAFGGLVSLAAGGGLLVDVSMRDASVAVRTGPGCPADHAVEIGSGGSWVAWHRGLRERGQRVLSPVELVGAAGG